jgi:hypothetical protein
LSFSYCIVKYVGFTVISNKALHYGWSGWLSRYIDWLRAGRSGDQIPVGARFSAPVQTDPGAHPAFCAMGTGSFPGVKSDRGVTLTPHLLLVPLVMKEYSYTSTPPMSRTACTEPQCLYKDALYFYFYYVMGQDVSPKVFAETGDIFTCGAQLSTS